MPADNELYNLYGASWWQEDSFLHTLKTGLNPARFGYFVKVFDRLGIKPEGLRVLDAGCGGGILSEEFARLGCRVTGIDLSFRSCGTARQHAGEQGLTIDYLSGSDEALPFGGGSFDVVVCCDVLEHVSDVEAVIAETARVLRPGGLYLFDTINRTAQSYFETILVGQELPFTRFFAAGTHDWGQFIRPEEIERMLEKNKLAVGELTGLGPGISPLATLTAILLLKTGRINFAEFGRRLKFRYGGGMGGSYIGFASAGEEEADGCLQAINPLDALFW